MRIPLLRASLLVAPFMAMSPAPASALLSFDNITTVDENLTQTGVDVLSLLDPLNLGLVSYTIAGGDDAHLFATSGTDLVFVNAPDFEAPADANGDNRYEVILESNLLGLLTKNVAIDVANVNDSAPVIATSLSLPVDENVTGTLHTFNATDADNLLPLTYSIDGGADASAFTLVGNELRFSSSPDYEAPSDSNGDNTFLVDIGVSDGLNLTQVSVDVTVTNVNDVAPNWVGPTTVNIVEGVTQTGLLTSST